MTGARWNRLALRLAPFQPAVGELVKGVHLVQNADERAVYVPLVDIPEDVHQYDPVTLEVWAGERFIGFPVETAWIYEALTEMGAKVTVVEAVSRMKL